MKKAVVTVMSLALSLTVLKTAQAAPASSELFQSGDVILQNSGSGQSAGIISASGFAYSHTGIIKKYPDGRVTVVEATGPGVIETPLSSWIGRGIAGQYSVVRKKGMTEDRGKAIVAAAEKYKGTPYDPLFKMHDTSRIYCSELVWQAYRDAGQGGLGHVQKIGSLDLYQPGHQGDPQYFKPEVKAIVMRIRMHPDCQQSYDGFFSQKRPPRTIEEGLRCWNNSISRADIITPAGLVSSQTETVFNNFACEKVPPEVCKNMMGTGSGQKGIFGIFKTGN